MQSLAQSLKENTMQSIIVKGAVAGCDLGILMEQKMLHYQLTHDWLAHVSTMRVDENMNAMLEPNNMYRRASLRWQSISINTSSQYFNIPFMRMWILTVIVIRITLSDIYIIFFIFAIFRIIRFWMLMWTDFKYSNFIATNSQVDVCVPWLRELIWLAHVEGVFWGLERHFVPSISAKLKKPLHFLGEGK